MTPICRLCGHHEKTGRTRCARLVRFKLENRVVDRSSESHNDGDPCKSRAIVADLKYKEDRDFNFSLRVKISPGFEKS
jgi:hypothetical protein